MLDGNSEIHYKLVLENKLLKLRGNEFQDFFTSIMQKKYPEFVKTRTWGRLGDRKCDGFLEQNGFITIYAVFAPNDISLAEFKRKFKNDIDGFSYWKGNKFVFVHNSIKGISGDHIKIVEDYKESLRIEIEICNPNEIEKIIFSLNEEKISELLGKVPNKYGILKTDYSHISSIIRRINNVRSTQILPIKPINGDKIKFNHLSEENAEFLRTGMSIESKFRDYFAKHPDIELGDTIGKHLNSFYEYNKSLFPNDPNGIFKAICLKIFECADETEEQRGAVQGLIAYYFQECDIMEEPINDTTN